MRKLLSLVVVLVLVLGLVGSTTAAPKGTPGAFLVVFRDQALSDSALAAIGAAGGTVTHRVDPIGVVAVTTPDSTRFLKAMLANTAVASVSPSLTLSLNLLEAEGEAQASSSPVDPTNPADYLFNIDRVTNGGAAWEIHSGTHDVVVAILDTGIDLNHPDLRNNIVPGSKSYVPSERDAQDYHSHGTHVAGSVAANGQIKGVAPGVGLRAYKVLSAGGSGSDAGIIQAIIDAADDGSDVINMSLGGFSVSGQYWYTDPATGERFPIGNDAASNVAWQRAIRYATNRGVTVVVAAGNEELNLARHQDITDYFNAYLAEIGLSMYEVQGATFVTPSTLPGVVNVSAMGGGWGSPDRLAFYSNYQLIDLSAPGGDLGPDLQNLEPDYYKYMVLSTVPQSNTCVLAKSLFGNCDYGWKGGTSMASPHVAGVAALIISEEYARTGKKPQPAQVVAKLKQSAEDIGKSGKDAEFGHGLVNAFSALGGR